MADNIHHPVLGKAIDECFAACESFKDEDTSVQHGMGRVRSMSTVVQAVREDTRRILVDRKGVRNNTLMKAA